MLLTSASIFQISDRDMEDGHIAPFACYELAMLMLNDPGTYRKGKDLLKHCKVGVMMSGIYRVSQVQKCFCSDT